MGEKALTSLAALGIALAPALLKFAEVRSPGTSGVEVEEDAEVLCISDDNATVHDRFEGGSVETHLSVGGVVQVISKRKNWRHVAFVNEEEAALGWVTAAHLAECQQESGATGTSD